MALFALIAAVLTGCASMIVVSVETDSVTGPKQVRQYGDINPKDITVYAEYKDGSRKPLSISKNDISFDNSKPGTQTVNVKTVKDTVSFQTEVMPLTGITVTSSPKAWKLGVSARVPKSSGMTGGAPAAPGNDQNNWPGLEIQAAWDQMGGDKLSASAIADDCQFTGFDPNKAGAQTVTVAWKGKQTTFNVQVVGMESIKIAAPPTKTTYYSGEPFAMAGLKVTGVWPGIGEETVNVAQSDITGYNPANKGRQTLTVNKDGKTATFTVEVLDLLAILNGTWVNSLEVKDFGTDPATVVGKRTTSYMFNNGSFTCTYTMAYTAGESAGKTDQSRVSGTYTIAPKNPGSNAANSGLASGTNVADWNGKVTFTPTGGDIDKMKNYTTGFLSFSIDKDPKFLGSDVIKGTVLTVITTTANDTSTYKYSYVKQ